MTFLLVAGVSLSNVDIRAQAELAGLLLLAVFPAIGFFLTRRAGTPATGLVVNGLLALLVIVLAVVAVAAKRSPAPPARTAALEAPRPSPLPVWIDADLACGSGTTSDVDDCWALALALRSPELDVVGISTVGGNAIEGDADAPARRAALAQSILALAGRNVAVFPGGERGGYDARRNTPATEALASALAGRRLTLLALGPVTNIATVLARRPDLARNVDRIVMVAGKRPGRLFHPGRHWWFHFGDFNVASDVAATRAVLAAGVPLTLVPFELAIQVAVTDTDLDRLRAGSRLARWLVEMSGPWLSFWQSGLMEKRGFSPFDALAVGYAARPASFECRDLRARMGFSVFLAPFGLGRDLEVIDGGRGVPVRYCHAVDPRFVSLMLERLQAGPRGG